MNFRSEVSTSSSRSSKAIVWINEVETAKRVDDVLVYH